MFFKDYAGARVWGPSPRGRTYQVRSPELKPPHHQNKQTNKQKTLLSSITAMNLIGLIQYPYI
jgi:hypothetical protein